MSNSKASFTVTVNLPDEASRDDIAWYILDAVSTMKGSYNPSSPIFGLEYEKVKVKDNSTKKVYINE